MILVCGGTAESGLGVWKKCYEYYGTGDWTDSTISLPSEDTYSGSGFADRVTKFLSLGNNKLWALGPSYGVNLVYHNNIWELGPQSPVGGEYCGLQLNATTTMIDLTPTNKVHLYNWETGEWSQGPSLNRPYSGHLCTTDSAGGKILYTSLMGWD